MDVIVTSHRPPMGTIRTPDEGHVLEQCSAHVWQCQRCGRVARDFEDLGDGFLTSAGWQLGIEPRCIPPVPDPSARGHVRISPDIGRAYPDGTRLRLGPARGELRGHAVRTQLLDTEVSLAMVEGARVEVLGDEGGP